MHTSPDDRWHDVHIFIHRRLNMMTQCKTNRVDTTSQVTKRPPRTRSGRKISARCGEPAISLNSHHVSLVQWTTCLLPVTRERGSNPLGGLMWNRDSPVGVVSLHWWPWRDWSSLWPRPEPSLGPRANNVINPTWSRTAFLSRFHARCRSPFRLHNWQSRLLGGEPCGKPAISLHSHHVSLVQWTTCLLPVTRDPGSNPLGGTYVKPGFSC